MNSHHSRRFLRRFSGEFLGNSNSHPLPSDQPSQSNSPRRRRSTPSLSKPSRQGHEGLIQGSKNGTNNLQVENSIASNAAFTSLTSYSSPSLQSQKSIGRKPLSPPTVMLVDNQEFGRSSLGRILESMGYRVLQVSHGAQALLKLREIPLPNLIILDLVLPEFTGWEFCERQRRNERLAYIPIVIVSGITTCVRQHYPAVVDQFAKPVCITQLLASVQKHCPLHDRVM